MSLKVLFIQPPVCDFYETQIRLQPLGLGYLQAVLNKHFPDIESSIVDFHLGWGKRSLPIPKQLGYLRNFYQCSDKSPFSTFYQYYRFGANREQIRRFIESDKPDVICVSSMFTAYYQESLEVAEIAKDVSDDAITVLGGSHVSSNPESVLSHPAVDYIIVGEAEKTFVELIGRLRESSIDFVSQPILGLGFKRQGEISLNIEPNLYSIDELPFPNYRGLDLSKYKYQGRSLSFMMFSRGCPYRCNFCSVESVFKRYRVRPIKSVIQEMKYWFNQGVRVFDFEDDNLSVDRQSFINFCNLVSESFTPDDNIELMAMNGLSYHNLDTEVLQAMRRAYFKSLNLSLVSSQQEVLAQSNRPHSVDGFAEFVGKARAMEFDVTTYLIIGLPHDTKSNALNSLAFLAELPVRIGASIFYLIPNSRIAKKMATEIDPLLSRMTAMAIETAEFSREDLFTLFICARILNFLKGYHPDSKVQVQTLKKGIESRTGFSSTTGFGHRLTEENRQKLGWEILSRLDQDKRFYHFDGRDYVENPNFNVSLYQELMAKMPIG